MNPVDLAARCRNKAGELDRLPEIVGPKPRPATERAKAEVIAKLNVRRDFRREVSNLGQIALD